MSETFDVIRRISVWKGEWIFALPSQLTPDRRSDGPYPLSELSAAGEQVGFELSTLCRNDRHPVASQACADSGGGRAPGHGRGSRAALGMKA
jgi:hypothetical protein